jgi:serine/threonine protein phosphatase PrpC
MFDVALHDGPCPRCGQTKRWRIQYHYGRCRNEERLPGGEIWWCDPPGRAAPLDDQGENTGGLVVVPGLPEQPCGRCGLDEPAAVWFRDNTLLRVELAHEVERLAEDPVLVRPSPSWPRVWSRRVAGSRNEDRLEITCSGARWTLVIADGAGGTTGGAQAAAQASVDLADRGLRDALDEGGWCQTLRQLDEALASGGRPGETTAVVLQLIDGHLTGASVGDSGALLFSGAGVIDLTGNQARKPLVGSGRCQPRGIARQPWSGRLLLATDGLLAYVPWPVLVSTATRGSVQAATEALVAAARLPSGGLQDDIALVLAEPGEP